MKEPSLKDRLADWAAAYAGEQFARLGYGTTDRVAHAPVLMAAVGESDPMPAAEAIERIVQCMERDGRWRESRVLRTECFLAGLSEVDRLQRLSRAGLAISRSSYYIYLGSARAYVESALLQRQIDGRPTREPKIPGAVSCLPTESRA